MNRNNLSSQFHVTHDKLGAGWHALTLSNMDSSHLARVSFEHYNDPHSEPSSRIDIDYLKSNVEGQGHAQRLMDHMYNRYPKSHIDWGLTINPASTHIASKFEDKYYDRTSYQPEEGLD